MLRMRRSFFVALVVPLVVLAASLSAHADTFFGANITHGQEPPPAGTDPFLTSTGAARGPIH